MYAVFHALLLWHKRWEHGKLQLFCDNEAVVDGINKKSIRGPAIHPLQSILLIAAVFGIELVACWIPTEENMIADALSRFEFEKLKKLELTSQINSLLHRRDTIKTSNLRQRLISFFTTPLRRQRDSTMQQASAHTAPSPWQRTTLHSSQSSTRSSTDSLTSAERLNSKLDRFEQIMEHHPQRKLKIVWIPGHMDIEGNEHADQEAKRAATDPIIHQSFRHPPLKSSRIQQIKAMAKTQWNRQWTENTKTSKHLRRISSKQGIQLGSKL
jgi:ribonuclease HI